MRWDWDFVFVSDYQLNRDRRVYVSGIMPRPALSPLFGESVKSDVGEAYRKKYFVKVSGTSRTMCVWGGELQTLGVDETTSNSERTWGRLVIRPHEFPTLALSKAFDDLSSKLCTSKYGIIANTKLSRKWSRILEF